MRSLETMYFSFLTMVQNNGPPWVFDRFESFGHDKLTAKHCYFRCSRPPDVDVIKIFDKDDQATKHCFLS